MRKLNKTETEIMEEIRTQGFAVIMSGYRTLRKRGSYGNRRHNAAIRLRDVFGLIKFTKINRYMDCGPRFSDHWSECKIVAKDNPEPEWEAGKEAPLHIL